MDPDGAGGVRVRLFGAVCVERNGTTVDLVSSAHRRIIGRLALSPFHVVALHTLVDVLWPDDPPRTATASVASQIYRLRGIVGSDMIRTVSPGYLLAVEPDAIDVHRFQRHVQATSPPTGADASARPGIDLDHLDEALSLWTGEPLDGFADEPWARPWVVRLSEEHAVASERRVDALLRLVRFDEAVADATAFCEAEPLRERAHMLLMQALGHQGRAVDALRVFDRFRKRLARETGLEPSSAIVAIERDLLGHAGVSAPPDSDLFVVPTLIPQEPAKRPRRSNLPVSGTSFVGRVEELESIGSALREHRLVTVVGPGGVGKTRVALEVARSASWAVDGTLLVELASLRDDAQVAPTVAAAIGIVATGTTSVAESIGEWCSSNRALLVLDNCEHVLDGVASLLATVLARGPCAVVISTSREPLRVDGEHLVAVGPMPLPEGPMDETDAVRLFVTRARDECPGFDPTADREAIVEICVRLDGIPLAIELAAARLRALSARSIADHLDERFRLLTAGRRTAVERHRTLRAAVDWSYELLDAPQKALFERLSVFGGAFDLDDAVGVCAADDLDELAVLELLAALVDRSLVAVRTVEPPYRMLETLRSYGMERLDAAGAHDARRAHGEWFRTKAERSRDRSIGPDERRVRDIVLAQLPDYDAAAAWGFDHDEPSIGIDIAFFLFEPFWFTQMRPLLSMSAITNWLQEQRWRQPNFGYPKPLLQLTINRARCVSAAWLGAMQGDPVSAHRIAEQITTSNPDEIWGHVLLAFTGSFLGTPADIAAFHDALQGLIDDPIRHSAGCITYYNRLLVLRRVDEARRGILEYLAWTSQIGSKIAAAGALGLRGRADTAVDPDSALAHFEAGIRIAREAKSLAAAHMLQRLRISLLVDKAHPDALRSCHEALENSRDTGDRGDLGSYLTLSATTLSRRGDLVTAARIAGHVDVGSLMIGNRRRYQSTISDLQAALGPKFEILAAEGGSLDVVDLLDVVIAALAVAMADH